MNLAHGFTVAILPAYFASTILIGWFTRRRGSASNDYLNASRSLPLPIVTASYLAANCGALEIIGVCAVAAQYGVQALHFYYIGAIPAMIFLALWMMPVYRRSGVRSVPAYLEARFGQRLRLINACATAITLLMLGGISLYAMAQVLEVVAGLTFWTGTLLSAGVVLIYVYVGGVRATIYNEVFQLLVMMAGLLPVFFRTLRYARPSALGGGLRSHLWAGMSFFAPSRSFDHVGVVVGLGFVLSFGYWCTDFVLMQRAFAARTEFEARQVPLWSGFGKLLFSFLVVVPGLAAACLFPNPSGNQRYDQALPRMMLAFCGPVPMALGLTALAASLMSGLSANVSAFAAVWTEDIYRVTLRKHEAEDHYLTVGRMAIVVAVGTSVVTSFVSFYFNNLMEHVQLLFSLFNAPFWAVFLLGMTTRRTTAPGALWGFICGVVIGFVHHGLAAGRYIKYGSPLNATFYLAVVGFAVTVVVSSLVSYLGRGDNSSHAPVLTFNWGVGMRGKDANLLWALALVLAVCCFALNVFWW